MLDQFYKFLANRVLDYFKNTNINSGDRYEIQFEKEDDVKSLYNEIKAISEINIFNYQVSNKYSEYNTYAIKANKVNIIVAATIDGIKPDFLARLRNEVSISTREEFRNSAILFIHTSNKDTITDGVINFQKEGMPFHSRTLIRDINKLIEGSKLEIAAKYVLKFDLNRMEREDSDEGQSILQYSDILSIVNKGNIKESEFKEFGLFYDGKLNNIIDEKEALKRLEENARIYLKIDNIHKYGGDIENNLEKFLDDNGKNKLKQKKWYKEDFKFVKQSMENFLVTDLIYEGSYIEHIDKKFYWEKAEGNTKAQKQKRNIIIFNKDKLDTIKLEFKFEGKLESKNLSRDVGKNLKANTSNKKIIVEINELGDEISFSKITYSWKSKYEFKILVIPMDNKIFEDTVFRTNYLLKMNKKVSSILIPTYETELVLNPYEEEEEEITLKYQEEEVFINSLEKKIRIKNKIRASEDEEVYKFQLNIQGVKLPINIIGNNSKTKRVSGRQVWINKIQDKSSYKYLDNKIIRDETVNYAFDDFKRNLDREEYIINSEGIAFKEIDGELETVNLFVDNELLESYKKVIKYYKSNNLLPSLAFIDGELKQLLIKYVNLFNKEIAKINEGDNIEKTHIDLLKIGTVLKDDSIKQILLTPLHPLNISYQLMITEELGDKVISNDVDLAKEISNKLDSINLLPYIAFDDNILYKAIDQNHSKEWKLYTINDVNFNTQNRDFVKKLVREKINEFVKHFRYLFISVNSAIKINLINTGYSKDILQGIIDYYIPLLNNKSIDKILPIKINIYSRCGVNIFEELQNYTSAEEIEEYLGVNFGAKSINKRYSKDDILDIINTKVSYYQKNYNSSEYEYSHITFYEMEHELSEKDSKMNDINTGISLGGILSSIPSKEISGTYRTGYGTKFLDEKNILLKLASIVNALVRAVENQSPFKENECRTTAISNYNEEQLQKIYSSSNWVTFINPMVGLQFFKDTIKEKDLLVIHYSDQYTPSSGYDSITVTKKTKQYKDVIKEFLDEKNIKVDEKSELITKVINCFNAINGDWLLKIISCNGQEDREKLSIISAIKLSLSYFYNKDIIWVPISLEEILRVSKGCGLSSKEGLFSVKNLKGEGSYSDDLLLVGIECMADTSIEVHYYPIEVKIGQVKSDVIRKAKIQAYRTRNHIEKHVSKFNNKELQTKIFRDFMIKLVLVSIEKLKLYNVWDEQDWDKIIDSDIRMKLLNDEYNISNSLDKYIGRGAIFTFKSDVIFEKNGQLVSVEKYELGEDYNEDEFEKGNQILEVNFPEGSGYRNILRDIEEIKDSFIEGKSDIQSEKLLYNLYQSQKTEKVSDVVSEKTIQEDNDSIQNVKVDHEVEALSILFGNDIINDKEIIWNPTDSSQNVHTNTGIIGTMGTGKTQFTKSLIYQLNKNTDKNVNGKKIGLLIFDYKGDYIDEEFIEATNAKVYDIYHLPFNPLELVQGNKVKQLLPLHTANALKQTISTAFKLGPLQESRLKELIMNAYERRGIKKADIATWKRTPPTMKEVCKEYLEDEEVKQDKLYMCLEKIIEFEIFHPDANESKSLYDMIDGVTVINLSDNDPDIQNLVVGIILDIFYSQMKVLGESSLVDKYRQLSKMILVDEADNFLSQNFDSLKRILKEGRMFGVGTILSTQLLSHFSTGDNEYANYILTWIIHKVSDLSIKDIKYIFNTTNKTQEDEIFNKIKSLEKHRSLVKLGDVEEVLYMNDNAFWMDMVKEKDLLK